MDFEVIVLGCLGGPFENNASSYLVYRAAEKEVIALDAGTVLHGLMIAYERGQLENFPLFDEALHPVAFFLKNYLKAYLISHAHLDHIAGMVFASQIDGPKPIFGSEETLNFIRNNIFNNKIWANMGDEGERATKLYSYKRLKEFEKVSIPGTHFSVESFRLNHGKVCPSTAFLIESKGKYLLYFGDTSSDFVEKTERNRPIWERVAPLIREKKLRALFLECSFPNSESHALYGHLTPRLLLQELEQLEAIAATSIEGLNVIVTHRKESLQKGSDPKEVIAQELTKGNKVKVNFHFPKQGEKILL